MRWCGGLVRDIFLSVLGWGILLLMRMWFQSWRNNVDIVLVDISYDLLMVWMKDHPYGYVKILQEDSRRFYEFVVFSCMRL